MQVRYHASFSQVSSPPQVYEQHFERHWELELQTLSFGNKGVGVGIGVGGFVGSGVGSGVGGGMGGGVGTGLVGE
jgi:hypothetical protein